MDNLQTIEEAARTLKRYRQQSEAEQPDTDPVHFHEELAQALEGTLVVVSERDPLMADVVDYGLFGRDGGVDCPNCGRRQTYVRGRGCEPCGILDDELLDGLRIAWLFHLQHRLYTYAQVYLRTGIRPAAETDRGS